MTTATTLREIYEVLRQINDSETGEVWAANYGTRINYFFAAKLVEYAEPEYITLTTLGNHLFASIRSTFE